MSLVAGTVTVAPDGTASGSGMALQIFNEMKNLAVLPDPDNPPAGFTSEQVLAVLVSSLEIYAQQAQAIANGVVPHILDNLVIRIPADAFGSGIPATEVLLSGVFE